MPLTLVHGVISFFALSFFTKDRRLWLLAFVAGMLPDLDGLPLLWDIDLFYALHHELLHPLIYGIILGIPLALLLNHFLKIGRIRAFAIFAAAYMLHPLGDVLFTNWPVRLLWPFISQEFSYPVFINHNFALLLLAPAMLVLPFAIENLLGRDFNWKKT